MIETVTPLRDGHLSVPTDPERKARPAAAYPSQRGHQADQKRRTQVEAWTVVTVRAQTELKHSVEAARLSQAE